MPYHIIIGDHYVSGLCSKTLIELFKNPDFLTQNLDNIDVCLENIQPDIKAMQAEYNSTDKLREELSELADNQVGYEEAMLHLTNMFNIKSGHEFYILKFLINVQYLIAYKEFLDYFSKQNKQIHGIDIIPSGATRDTYLYGRDNVLHRSEHMSEKILQCHDQGRSTISIVGPFHLLNLYKILKPKINNSHFILMEDIGYAERTQNELQHYDSSFQMKYSGLINKYKRNFFWGLPKGYELSHPEICHIKSEDAVHAAQSILIETKILESQETQLNFS